MTAKIMSSDEAKNKKETSGSPEAQRQNASINLASDLRNQMNHVQSSMPAQQLPKAQIFKYIAQHAVLSFVVIRM
jgi:hypothetical protein